MYKKYFNYFYTLTDSRDSAAAATRLGSKRARGDWDLAENGFALAFMVVSLSDSLCQVPSLRASKWKKKIFFAFTSMVVFLEDRQCQVPSLRASEWKKIFFAFTSMVVLLEDRQCQVLSPRASKWKK